MRPIAESPATTVPSRAGVARPLRRFGIRGIEGRNLVRDVLLWILGICVTIGIGCIVANAVLWWRDRVKRRRGAAWWTRL